MRPSHYHAVMTATTDRLPFTGDDEADRLLVASPLALLIGFALDQQVTVQKAFSGPAELQRRLGHLDAAKIAATDPVMPKHPTLGDVDSAEALAGYQAGKRAHKASLRAAKD